MGLDYKLHLRCTRGEVNLPDITKVFVKIPISLIKSIGVEDHDRDEAIMKKSADTVKLFFEELKIALGPSSPCGEWAAGPCSVRPLRDLETGDLIGVGFRMSRPHKLGQVEDLDVDIYCDARPLGGELSCEVIDWGLVGVEI